MVWKGGSRIFSTELKHKGNDPEPIQIGIVKSSFGAALDGLHSAIEKATGTTPLKLPITVSMAVSK